MGDGSMRFSEGPNDFVHDMWRGNFPHRVAGSYEMGVVAKHVREYINGGRNPNEMGPLKMLMIGLGPGLIIDTLYINKLLPRKVRL